MRKDRHGIIIGALLLCMALLPSCGEKESKPVKTLESLRFSCVLQVDGSRVPWSEADVISLYDGTVAADYKGTAMKRSSAFSGVAATLWAASCEKANMYYAVYPQSKLDRWASDGRPAFAVTVPSRQVASQDNPGGLSQEASFFVARCHGKDLSFNFEPALALVGFTLEETSPLVCAVDVESRSGASLAGKCEIDLSAFDPTIPSRVQGTASKVTLESFDGECPLDAGTYYIGILPGSYNPGDLTITFHYTNGASKTESLPFSGKLQGGLSFAYGTVQPVPESGEATIQDPGILKIEDKYDIYLMIGQSNMAGRGYLLDSDKTEVVDRVYLLGPDDEKGQAEPVKATHPFNQYSTVRKDLSMQQMHIGYQFSKVIRDHTDGRPVLLVCNALGGSALAQWAKGEHLYNEAVRRTLLAMQYGRLKGILWHQGCSDSSAAKVEVYMGNLKKMVESLREDLDSPGIPFIAGELPYWRSNSAGFNTMIRTIRDNIPNSDWVSAEGCTMRLNTSDPHFSRDGLILLGSRYADKVLAMVYDIY